VPSSRAEASADALTVAGADLKALRATIGNERARLDALLAKHRDRDHRLSHRRFGAGDQRRHRGPDPVILTRRCSDIDRCGASKISAR
jgi:hypothetical protein